MKHYLNIIGLLITAIIYGCIISSCGYLKEIPIQYVDRIEYRDSLVYVHDSIEIQVPVEVVKEVLPALDTSYLRTSVAESVAYLDTTKKQLHHTLEQKGSVKTVYDTIIKVEYVDRLVEKEVPVHVEVVKYKYDTLFWVLAAWALLCVLYVVLKIVVKF